MDGQIKGLYNRTCALLKELGWGAGHKAKATANGSDASDVPVLIIMAKVVLVLSSFFNANAW